MEENVTGFGIETSTDGQRFTQAAFVPARNQSSAYSYEYPLVQNSWFRLRLEDQDGTVSYSKILYMAITGSSAERILLYDNPGSGDQLSLRIVSRAEQDGRLIVSGLSGQTVWQAKVHLTAGDNAILRGTGGLSAGVYMVSFIGDHSHIGPVKWVRL